MYPKPLTGICQPLIPKRTNRSVTGVEIDCSQNLESRAPIPDGGIQLPEENLS
jgi:hypothetical protein